ncbi:Basic 7S globulin [Camellia lanceoleosa]|uniref:Basic 7S globulin n=1 Tax=Camellia lanceoleosa TaxID=1840588 RepID=A0ACC0I724_9ERIC|nr:Basic 7S globulin [Camellia lanceoleosa]
MASSLYLFFSSLVLFFFLSHSELGDPNPTNLVYTIIKDVQTLQYYTEIQLGSNVSSYYRQVVIDLGGQLLWFNCHDFDSTSYRPIRCGSAKCKAAKGSQCTTTTTQKKMCGVLARNSIKNLVAAEVLLEDVSIVGFVDRLSHLYVYNVSHVAFSCANSSFLLEGLAKATKGMVGLGRTQTALPIQIASAFKLPNKFAFCLPSSTGLYANIYIGGAPYYLNPSTLNFTKSLTTTPLIVNAAQPDEYFINVKSIRVDGTKLVSFNTSLLSIDRNGVGGTKLSTITPYTILQTCIYKCLVSEFVKKALSRKIKMGASVAPFGACFSSKTMASTITGAAVPSIDLVVRKGVYWRIYGANSMVRVNKDVSCLGFVDGGPHPITSVVLGGYQMEDHFLEFDLTSSKLGFSSSLLLYNSSCSLSRTF